MAIVKASPESLEQRAHEGRLLLFALVLERGPAFSPLALTPASMRSLSLSLPLVSDGALPASSVRTVGAGTLEFGVFGSSAWRFLAYRARLAR